MNPKNNFTLQCPIPKSEYAYVMLAHGGGGKLTKQLIDLMFYPLLDNAFLRQGHDGAVLPSIDGELAMSTDSFVVDPLFFPGGDIGELAVNGTVNDLVCCGAEPLYISLAFILEEGFLMDDLWMIVQSIALSAQRAGVQIVTGDTKGVEKGKGDKIFINTAGLGRILPDLTITPERCSAGDAVIINSLRFYSNSSLKQTISQENSNNHLILALNQKEGFYDKGTDYRGNAVLAYVFSFHYTLGKYNKYDNF